MMKRSEAIAELELRKTAEIEANGNYRLGEALTVAIRCMEVLESLKSHIRKHGYEEICDETCGIQIPKSFIENFIFENEKLDFYVDLKGDSE